MLCALMVYFINTIIDTTYTYSYGEERGVRFALQRMVTRLARDVRVGDGPSQGCYGQSSAAG
jgi:hypothetical protein